MERKEGATETKRVTAVLIRISCLSQDWITEEKLDNT
jgi:hypothetical protein